MKPFGIVAPSRILFGRGEAAKTPDLLRPFGGRVLLVRGATAGRAGWLADAIASSGGTVEQLACDGEPTLAALEAAVARHRAFRPEVVVAIGGGAAMDLGKAVAAMLPAPGGVLDHLEVVGAGRPLAADPIPFVALPTTAGTGAEVTKNAVIGVPELGRKASLRDDRMIARIALVDPALTDGCPRPVTLAAGLDAITQVVEPYLSGKATPYTDALSRPAIAAGLSALKRLMDGEDAQARDRMAFVSLSGGLALANSGLGAVHGLAGVIGGVCGAPHGAICGGLLGPVLAINRQRSTGGARERVEEVCVAIAGIFGGTADDAPETLTRWARAKGLPGLAGLGLDPSRHAEVAAAAQSSSSMKGNPVPLSDSDLVVCLEQAA